MLHPRVLFHSLPLLFLHVVLNGCPESEPVVEPLISPGSLHVVVASAAGVSFEEGHLSVERLSVQACAGSPSPGWIEFELEDSRVTLSQTELVLPEMRADTLLCGLRLEFSDKLELAGNFPVDGGQQDFVLGLDLPEFTLSFGEPLSIPGEGQLALLLQLGMTDWIVPNLIGVPPEPKREGLIEVDGDHPVHWVLCQQILRFSGVYEDLDGDGQVSVDEAESPLSGDEEQPSTLPGTGFLAVGGSECLDFLGAETDCTGPDVELYSPVAYLGDQEGITYTLGSVRPAFEFDVTTHDVAYDGEYFVAVGHGDSQGSGSGQGVFLTSLDGDIWGGWSEGESLYGVVKGGEGMPWVAVGEACSLLYSRDGVVWNDVSCEDSGVKFKDVAFTESGPEGGGLFVAVGLTGNWAWSSDGILWNHHSGLLHPDNALSQMTSATALSDGRIVAVGLQGDVKILENPEQLGSAEAEWLDAPAPFNPDLLDVISYSLSAEEADVVLAVGSQGGLSPLLTFLDLGTDQMPISDNLDLDFEQVKTVARTAGEHFVVGGALGLASWVGSPIIEVPIIASQEEVAYPIHKVVPVD